VPFLNHHISRDLHTKHNRKGVSPWCSARGYDKKRVNPRRRGSSQYISFITPTTYAAIHPDVSASYLNDLEKKQGSWWYYKDEWHSETQFTK